MATVHYCGAILISATLEYELEFFTPQGTMFFFGLCNLGAFIFCTHYVLETQGLTDKEKKSIYIPSHLMEPT